MNLLENHNPRSGPTLGEIVEATPEVAAIMEATGLGREAAEHLDRQGLVDATEFSHVIQGQAAKSISEGMDPPFMVGELPDHRVLVFTDRSGRPAIEAKTPVGRNGDGTFVA